MTPTAYQLDSTLWVPPSEPADRLPDDPCRGEEQKTRFDEGGNALDLGVAEVMGLVSRFVAHPHREVRQQCRQHVESGMSRLRKDRKTAGEHADDPLAAGEQQAGEDGRKRDALFALCPHRRSSELRMRIASTPRGTLIRACFR